MRRIGSGILTALLSSLFLSLASFPFSLEETAPQASAAPYSQSTLPAVTPVPTEKSVFVRINQIEDSRFPEAMAYVAVTELGGAPVAGLEARDFELVEDGRPVAQFDVSSGVNSQEPLAVALVLDVSGSMEGRSIELARQAAASFLGTLAPRDTVELISFSTDVKVNVPFTTTKTIIAKGIDNLRAAGDTALYDAVAVAADSLGHLSPGRKLTVLLTDGEDTKSRRSLETALSTVANRRVPTFIVALGDKVDKPVLERITEVSGGSLLYAPSPSDLANAYRTLGDQLRSQYVLRFTSALKADRAQHELTVRLNGLSGLNQSVATFVAQQNPPWIDIVSPRTRALITGIQRIEVKALPGASGARIERVSFSIDDQVLSGSEGLANMAELDATRLAPGQHSLKVTVVDSAGNSASQEISFTVPVPSGEEASPDPKFASAIVAPGATPVAEDGSNRWALPVGAVAVALIGSVIALALRRSRSTTTTCSRCGTYYTSSSCPTCAMEDRDWLRRRLREIAGHDARREQPVRPDQRAGSFVDQ